MSSPFALAIPIALERELRSDCNVSVCTCNTFRCSSSAINFSTSKIKLRLTLIFLLFLLNYYVIN